MPVLVELSIGVASIDHLHIVDTQHTHTKRERNETTISARGLLSTMNNAVFGDTIATKTSRVPENQHGSTILPNVVQKKADYLFEDAQRENACSVAFFRAFKHRLLRMDWTGGGQRCAKERFGLACIPVFRVAYLRVEHPSSHRHQSIHTFANKTAVGTNPAPTRGTSPFSPLLKLVTAASATRPLPVNILLL